MTSTAPHIATRSFEGLDIPEPGTFGIDASHSVAQFTVRHLMVAKTKGRFTGWRGEITIAEEPLNSRVSVAIDAASITTGDIGRDDHLRSPDFLEVDAYPTITFESRAVRHVSHSHFEVAGELTIHGVTKPVTLALDYEGLVRDPWGGERAVFSAQAKINREDFGLTWNQALETGGVLVGKEVTIDLEVEAVRS